MQLLFHFARKTILHHSSSNGTQSQQQKVMQFFAREKNARLEFSS